MQPNTVHVQMAFSYTCPKCGHEGFVKAVTHEFAHDEAQELAEQLGETPRTGDWLTHPETITCGGCGVDLRALNQHELVGADQ